MIRREGCINLLLWSVVPDERVFDGIDKARNFQEVQYLGRNLLVESSTSGKGVIVQVLSTNPEDFLQQELLPGTEIKIP